MRQVTEGGGRHLRNHEVTVAGVIASSAPVVSLTNFG
jgi:hypothetical protein